jgi:hypothetical protein
MKTPPSPYKALVPFWLILILVCNIGAGLFYSAKPPVVSDNSGIESLFSDRILICTAEGFKYISLADFKKGGLPQGHDPRPHCPLCILTALALDKYIPTVITLDFTRQTSIFAHYYDDAPLAARSRLAHMRHPRAPPYFL